MIYYSQRKEEKEITNRKGNKNESRKTAGI